VARHLVENCPDLKVRNFFTIGGPHRGVAAVPYCSTGMWCKALTYISEHLSEYKTIQDDLNPASYFRDPSKLTQFMADSIFLPYLNNEKDFSQTKKQQILNLNHAVFVMTNQDDVVYPRESAIFGELQADGTVLNRVDTEIWKQDLLGLKTLEDAGKATFLAIDGAHVEFTYAWWD